MKNSHPKTPPEDGESPVFGIVIEALPNTLFKLQLEDDREILAYLGGKMRINRIRVLVGDRVQVLLDPYGGKGRIVRRL